MTYDLLTNPRFGARRRNDMTDRKSIAYALDRAAGRAESVNRTGASRKQCWYLAGLAANQGRDAKWLGFPLMNTNAALTAKEASRLIDDLLRRQAAQ